MVICIRFCSWTVSDNVLVNLASKSHLCERASRNQKWKLLLSELAVLWNLGIEAFRGDPQTPRPQRCKESSPGPGPAPSRCAQTHPSFSWALPQPVCQGWKEALLHKNNFIPYFLEGLKAYVGISGAVCLCCCAGSSLRVSLTLLEPPQPPAPRPHQPRPHIPALFPAQGVSPHTSSVCSRMCETRGRKGTGKEEECGECGDTNWLTSAAVYGVRH